MSRSKTSYHMNRKGQWVNDKTGKIANPIILSLPFSLGGLFFISLSIIIKVWPIAILGVIFLLFVFMFILPSIKNTKRSDIGQIADRDGLEEFFDDEDDLD